jgi:hypothetical protein
MKDMDDEFDEFDTTEDEIDAMMAAGEPVDVDVPGEFRQVDRLYVVMGVPLTWGGASVTPNVGSVAPSVKVAAPTGQSGLAA